MNAHGFKPLCFGSVTTWYKPDRLGRIPAEDIYGYTIPDEVRNSNGPPRVSANFERGLRNALIISVLFFWAPLIFLITWLVNR